MVNGKKQGCLCWTAAGHDGSEFLIVLPALTSCVFLLLTTSHRETCRSNQIPALSSPSCSFRSLPGRRRSLSDPPSVVAALPPNAVQRNCGPASISIHGCGHNPQRGNQRGDAAGPAEQSAACNKLLPAAACVYTSRAAFMHNLWRPAVVCSWPFLRLCCSNLSILPARLPDSTKLLRPESSPPNVNVQPLTRRRDPIPQAPPTQSITVRARLSLRGPGGSGTLQSLCYSPRICIIPGAPIYTRIFVKGRLGGQGHMHAHDTGDFSVFQHARVGEALSTEIRPPETPRWSEPGAIKHFNLIISSPCNTCGLVSVP